MRVKNLNVNISPDNVTMESMLLFYDSKTKKKCGSKKLTVQIFTFKARNIKSEQTLSHNLQVQILVFTPQPLRAVRVLFSPMMSGWAGGRSVRTVSQKP